MYKFLFEYASVVSGRLPKKLVVVLVLGTFWENEVDGLGMRVGGIFLIACPFVPFKFKPFESVTLIKL